MRVVNAARHVDARVTFATDKHARNSLLVVFKATYAIPANNRVPRPCVPPQPVALADVYAGEPGLSAILYENDLAASKAACDVVFRASAHSPDGEPCRSLNVVVRVGSMSKALYVVGDRTWEKDILILRASRPKPFITMPLHYGHAFGGWHKWQEGEEERSDVFQDNPFGRGYAKDAPSSVHGMPLPNLEVPGRAISTPHQGTVVALSPVPRTDPSRHRFAGTYDKQWLEQKAPFLPEDFDARFFQCVPEDQRIPFPVGGEEVLLVNMTPDRPEVRFCLPRLDTVPVRVLHRDYTVSQPKPTVDTLYFEPDEGRFSVVWRASLPLGQRPAHELRAVVVGEVCRLWWEGVRNGGSGCQGCGAAKGHDEGKDGGAKPAGCDPAAPLPPGAMPEFCPDRPEQPAKDPHWPLPEIRIVLSEPEKIEEEDEVHKEQAKPSPESKDTEPKEDKA